jgi:DNA-binding CsgD family transcriptional regulator
MSATTLAAPRVPLSVREVEMRLLLVKGLALKRLHSDWISASTLRSHRDSIYRKLRVHSRTNFCHSVTVVAAPHPGNNYAGQSA